MASALVCCTVLFPAALWAQSYCSRGVEMTNIDAATLGWVRIADDPGLEPQTFTLEAWITPKGNGFGKTTDGWGALVIAKPWEGSAGSFLVSYGLHWDPLNEKVGVIIRHTRNWDRAVFDWSGSLEFRHSCGHYLRWNHATNLHQRCAGQ